ALAAGVIDARATTAGDALDGADLVVLAAPATDCLSLLDALGGPLRARLAPGVVVTDVASTKAVLVQRASALGLRFVGGHPMAGRETAGFGAADGDLFRGRPWVVVPATGADDEAVSRVEALARACGAVPLRMDAVAHDAAVAGVSHMPLVLSAALVEAVAGSGSRERGDWPAAAALAATGWAGMTRLARGDAAMGAGIAATNAPAIVARLRDVREAIDAWLAVLEADGGPDEAAIAARLAAARDRLTAGVD
ncbi:MAG: prephenate dehydrogenase/arogenate dehydrogenase family protein, partial [Candidatus Limnocylindrales bacterium]